MSLLSRIKQVSKKPLLAALASGVLLSVVGCAQSLPQENKERSYALPNYQDTDLFRYSDTYMQLNDGKTGFYPLADGRSALLARLALIELAQNTLDVQYYIYRDDDTSRLMTWYLYQAAERGVRVRLLLDDMENRNDDELAALSAHPNVEVRLFNPFNYRPFKQIGFLYDFSRVNRRMHNKVVIADSAFAITGGRNIGDEYFSANEEVDFGDFDLLMMGEVIPQFNTEFDVYWNNFASIPIESLVDDVQAPTKEELAYWAKARNEYLSDSEYVNSLKTHPMMKGLMNRSLPFYWTNAALVYDSPDKVLDKSEAYLINDLATAIEGAKEEFLLISPYFVPTKEGAELLAKIASNGINVTILTNSLTSNDVFAVHGWYAKYRDILLKGGVKLYEAKSNAENQARLKLIGSSRSSLHSKAFMIDKEKIFVGSFNFDPRSAYLNTEMGVFVESKAFADVIQTNLNPLLDITAYQLSLDENGDILWTDNETGQVYDSEPESGLFLRLSAWFAGILPIESQL